jgi:hypothetical protein
LRHLVLAFALVPAAALLLFVAAKTMAVIIGLGLVMGLKALGREPGALVLLTLALAGGLVFAIRVLRRSRRSEYGSARQCSGSRW